MKIISKFLFIFICIIQFNLSIIADDANKMINLEKQIPLPEKTINLPTDILGTFVGINLVNDFQLTIYENNKFIFTQSCSDAWGVLFGYVDYYKKNEKQIFVLKVIDDQTYEYTRIKLYFVQTDKNSFVYFKCEKGQKVIMIKKPSIKNLKKAVELNCNAYAYRIKEEFPLPEGNTLIADEILTADYYEKNNFLYFHYLRFGNQILEIQGGKLVLEENFLGINISYKGEITEFDGKKGTIIFTNGPALSVIKDGTGSIKLNKNDLEISFILDANVFYEAKSQYIPKECEFIKRTIFFTLNDDTQAMELN